MERESRIESDFALREYRNSLKPRPSAEDQEAFKARIPALGAQIRAGLGPRATSNHDENGFPR